MYSTTFRNQFSRIVISVLLDGTWVSTAGRLQRILPTAGARTKETLLSLKSRRGVTPIWLLTMISIPKHAPRAAATKKNAARDQNQLRAAQLRAAQLPGARPAKT